MKEILKYKFYVTSIIPIVFILVILLARHYGGHVLFHIFAEFFPILIGFMMIIIVSYTYQFTKNNFLLYIGFGYFWIATLDLFHMLTYQGMNVFPNEDPNIMLTFWLAARFLEAFILFTAIFVNFYTISKLKVFILFGLVSFSIYWLAFSKYIPILYEQESGLTSLKINLEYIIVFILMLTFLTYIKKKTEFDKSIYYYIIASIVLTICTELTLTFYAKVDDSFTVLAHVFKFLSYWMIFLSMVKTSLEKPFKFLAHDSSTYNSIPFPSILVDAQGIIRQINDSTVSFLNLEKDKIINQNNHVLFHNPNIKEDNCDVCKAIKNGDKLLSHTLQREDSTYSCTVNPIHIEKTALGSVQVCIDISQQLKKEIELRVSEEKSRNLITKMMNAFALHEIIFNEKGEPIDYKFLEVNPAWEKIVGMKSETVIGKTVREVFPLLKNISFEKYNKIVQTGISKEFETYSLITQKYLYCYAYRPEVGKFAVFFNDITKRRQAEDLLHLESEKLKEAQLLSMIGSWEYDIKEDILTCSDQQYKLFGLTDFTEKLTKNSLLKYYHPDDINIADKDLLYSVNSKEVMISHNRIFRKNDGKLRYFEQRWRTVHENDVAVKIIGTTQDITEKKHNLMLLKEKKKELETIIQEAPNPMILHEEGGNILMLNKAWSDSSGFSLDDTPTIVDWIEHTRNDEESIIFMKKHIDSLYEITEKLDEGEFTFLNKNRDLVTWQVSSAPLGIIDGKRRIISSAMDITELKHKDEMLINQSRHAAMGEMISMIAHQWRQPLSAISMEANNILLDVELGNLNLNKSKEYANNISKQTKELSKTIDDFRNFFKPDKDILKVNIKDVLNQSLTMVGEILKNNNIEIKTLYETDKEVNAYPRELMQVFINIITNAKDALTHNKPDNAQINIRVYEDKTYVNTEICDNGGGIDVDMLNKIFDPYFSTKESKTGTGIGLYMSKMIITDHLSGVIEANNKDDGTCFTIRLLKD